MFSNKHTERLRSNFFVVLSKVFVQLLPRSCNSFSGLRTTRFYLSVYISVMKSFDQLLNVVKRAFVDFRNCRGLF